MTKMYMRGGVYYGTAEDMIDRIEELEAKLVTKKTCPLGKDCDLTIAWMAGRESAKDECKAKIAGLEAKLAKAETIVRILASAEWDDRLGEAVDLACAYVAEVDEE